MKMSATSFPLPLLMRDGGFFVFVILVTSFAFFLVKSDAIYFI